MASDYKLEGTIKLISDVQTFNSGFTKREFVVTDQDDKYPQDVKFECVKEKCALLDGCAVGDKVNVAFNIRGNEYNDRYYVNLVAWKIDKTAGGGQGAAAAAADSEYVEEPPPGHGDDATDDIPF